MKNIRDKIKYNRHQRDNGASLREMLLPREFSRRVMSHPDANKFNDPAPYVALTGILAQTLIYTGAVYTSYKILESIKDIF